MTTESASRTYSDFRFGDPAPTRKQFGYARSLGVRIVDGMTKEEVSIAIDTALPPTADDLKEAAHFGIPVTQGMSKWDVMSAIIDAEESAERNGPANKEQLEYIAEMHGVLPLPWATYVQAEGAIKYLERLNAPDCEKCGCATCVDDNSCVNCGRSLRKRRFAVPLRVLVTASRPRRPGLAVRAVTGAALATGSVVAGTSRLAVKTFAVGAKAAPVVRKHSVAAARKADGLLHRISGGDRIVYWCLLGFGVFALIAGLIVRSPFNHSYTSNRCRSRLSKKTNTVRIAGRRLCTSRTSRRSVWDAVFGDARSWQATCFSA